MNEAQIKDIIGNFLKQPAEKITAETLIDRSAITSSIILHRMYAKLAAAGFETSDYSAIKTYGQLLGKLNGNITNGDIIPTTPAVVNSNSIEHTPAKYSSAPGVGIDIESVSNIPVVEDFREDTFFRLNFAPSEISYCILQSNPYASFAGLFAAKEAMVKADISLRTNSFNNIVIVHADNGAPVVPGFKLSISHTENTAVAVAIKNNEPAVIPTPVITFSQTPQGSSSKLPVLIALLALALAAISMIIVLKS
jgi:phosphopantetheine--protein transferase-like protein